MRSQPQFLTSWLNAMWTLAWLPTGVHFCCSSTPRIPFWVTFQSFSSLGCASPIPDPSGRRLGLKTQVVERWGLNNAGWQLNDFCLHVHTEGKGSWALWHVPWATRDAICSASPLIWLTLRRKATQEQMLLLLLQTYKATDSQNPLAKNDMPKQLTDSNLCVNLVLGVFPVCLFFGGWFSWRLWGKLELSRLRLPMWVKSICGLSAGHKGETAQFRVEMFGLMQLRLTEGGNRKGGAESPEISPRNESRIVCKSCIITSGLLKCLQLIMQHPPQIGGVLSDGAPKYSKVIGGWRCDGWIQSFDIIKLSRITCDVCIHPHSIHLIQLLME